MRVCVHVFGCVHVCVCVCVYVCICTYVNVPPYYWDTFVVCFEVWPLITYLSTCQYPQVGTVSKLTFDDFHHVCHVLDLNLLQSQ